MARSIAAMRAAWLFTVLCVVAFAYHQLTLEYELRRQVSLLREQVRLTNELRDVELAICVEVYKANGVCGRTMVQFLERLGLDHRIAPVLTTGTKGQAVYLWVPPGKVRAKQGPMGGGD